VNSRLLVLLPLFGIVSCALLQAHSYEDLFRQAEELSVRRDYAGAIQKYKDALKLRPGAHEAMSNLGVMYHAVGQYPAKPILPGRSEKHFPQRNYWVPIGDSENDGNV